LERISKNDFKYLISHNILKINKQGNYKDITNDKKMVITGVNKNNKDRQSSNKNSKQKQRYILDSIYYQLIEEKNKDKAYFDLNKVKENQKYLVSGSVS
jgi:hypothetical protein